MLHVGITKNNANKCKDFTKCYYSRTSIALAKSGIIWPNV